MPSYASPILDYQSFFGAGLSGATVADDLQSLASGEQLALDERSLLRRGQALCEMVEQSVCVSDEFGVIIIECDAEFWKFHQGNGEGCTLRTRKNPKKMRMEKINLQMPCNRELSD